MRQSTSVVGRATVASCSPIATPPWARGMGGAVHVPTVWLSSRGGRWTLVAAALVALGVGVATVGGGLWLRHRRRKRRREETAVCSSVQYHGDSTPTLTPLHSMRQSRFEPVSLNRIWHLNNVTTGSDSCPSPLPLGEGEGPEELFAHGQEAFERALHLWSQSLQAATRDGSPLGSQIKTVLEQAQTLQHTSFSFRTASSELNHVDGSESDAESYHSIPSDFEEVPLPLGGVTMPRLYNEGVQKAKSGQVQARVMRTNLLLCSSDCDFLAKLYGVRLAFDHLLQSSQTREEFSTVGCGVMTQFLLTANRDAKPFDVAFQDMLSFVANPMQWAVMEEELTERGVVRLSFYDIALDFTLLDAFDDLDRLPGTIVSVLQNRWLTDRMKESALNAGIWAMIKAKKSMLKHPDGFMMRFYALSALVTPVLSWGFLGTNPVMTSKCNRFKEMVLSCLRDVFSLERVRYHSKEALAEDIHRVFVSTANLIRRDLHQPHTHKQLE